MLAHAIRTITALLLIHALGACSDGSDNPADGPVARATVSGPLIGGIPGTAAIEDLDAAGYIEEEFFLEGTATAYDRMGDWRIDGAWPAVPSTEAEYRSRLLVRRPVEAQNFSGIVIVEWFNVSSGVDLDIDFAFLHEEIFRQGHVWVGVSAQAEGIDGMGGSPLGDEVVGLRLWDPVRYSGLFHPGDSYSYDIFTQAGEVLKYPGEIDPLAGLRPSIVIADGESQSAFRMLTYVNAIHPLAQVYDGFLIHSRGGTGAGLFEGPDGSVPNPARVREDIDVPVFQYVTETDLYALGGGAIAFPPARQADTENVRTWEVTGTAHADADYLLRLVEQGEYLYDNFRDLRGILTLVNTAPQSLSMHAALRSLVTWVRDGTKPASAPPITTADGAIVRDERGNALGGLRLPHIEVPVATLSGEGVIPLSGSTTPFDEDTLAALYPTPESYIDGVRASSERAVTAGYLLDIDARKIIAEAEANTPVQ